MMDKSKIHNLTGQRFGRLLVLAFIAVRRNRSVWLCKCDCGKVVSVLGHNLTGWQKPTRSCGCLRAEACLQSERKREHAKNRNKLRQEMKNAGYL